MKPTPPPSLWEVLESVPDPRQPSGRRHSIGTVLAVSVLATLCGCRGWNALGRWMAAHGGALREHLRPARGELPSYSAVRRVFVAMDAAEFAARFLGWSSAATAAAEAAAPGAVRWVHVDGKALRGSASAAGAGDARAVLSAFAGANRQTLAQVAVRGGSNEITALAPLIAALGLEKKTPAASA